MAEYSRNVRESSTLIPTAENAGQLDAGNFELLPLGIMN